MSIVQFLETLGASSNAMSDAAYTDAVQELRSDQASRDALLRRDAPALNSALAGRAAMRCFVFVPD